MPRFSLAVVAATSVAATVTFAAHAADPESGTISNAAPKVEWSGTVASAGITNNAWAQDPTAPCQAPACDHFALKVADAGNVVLTLSGFAENTAGGDPGCGIRVTKPDGESEYFSSTCGPKTVMKVTLKNAPAGDYGVDVADSHVVSPTGPEPYKASASLAGVVAPAPAATPVPAPTPAPAAAIKLTVKVPKLSAKRLRKAKRFVVTLNSSGPLTGVNGLLVNRSRQLGSGRLASLNGTAKMTVRVKRALKRGTYQLSVGGKDGQGRNVVATARVKVSR